MAQLRHRWKQSLGSENRAKCKETRRKRVTSSESYKQKLRDIIEKAKQATGQSKEKQQLEAIKEVKSDAENNKKQ